MDPDSPVSRAERTFWTVWNYITGAVNRFLRPEPINTVNNVQPSAVHSEPVDSGHSESDPDGQEVSEHPPVTASLLSSSRPVVVWELCTTEIDLGPEEESTQLSEVTESKAPKESEGKREEEIGQTGNDDAGQLVCKNPREVENREGKLDTFEDEEDEKIVSQNLSEHLMTEDLEAARMASAGEESQGAMSLEDQQIVSKIHVTEGLFHVGEQHLKGDDAETAICLMTVGNSTHEHNMHIEEVQQTMAETEEEHGDAVSRLVSENENGNHETEEQFENQCLVCEELSEEDTCDKADSGLSSPNRELKMTITKKHSVSEDAGNEDPMAPPWRLQTLNDQQKVSETMKEEMLSVEQEDGEITLCLMSDLSSVEVQTVVWETEVEDIDAVSRLVSEKEHSNNEVEKQTTEYQLSREGTYGKEGSGLSFLNRELKMTVTESDNASEDVGRKHVMANRSESDEVEEEEEQRVSESTRNIQVKEESLSFEQVLEDSEITMCQMADLSPAGEHNVHIEEMQTTVAESENELDDNAVKKVENRNKLSANDKGDSGLTTEDAGHEYVMKSRSESDEMEDKRESVTEAAGNRTIQLAEVNNEDVLTKYVEEVQQSAEPQLHEAKEKEDVAKDHEVQSKTRDTDTVIDEKYVTGISVGGKLFVRDEEEEEDDNNESCVNTAHGILSGTRKSKGETGREICKAFKNTPLGIYEGQELHSPTYEETQEGVPGYNNQPGPDENITQWFLEEGHYKEIHATVLPEEVESGEAESLQNNGSGGDFSLGREHKEEEQGSTAEEQTRTNTGLLETERPGHLSEEEDERLAQNLKTTWTDSEEAFGTDRMVTELRGNTGELLGDSKTDEGVSEIRNVAEDSQKSTGAVEAVDLLVRITEETLELLESKREKMTETSISRESEATIGSEYESSKPPSLEDSAGLGDLKQADTTEQKLASETGVEAVENETLKYVSVDVAPTTLETRKQPSHEVFEILTDMAGADVLSTRTKPKVLTKSKENQDGRTSSATRCEDFIDEEILDLWIEAASFQDTNDEQETGQQMHVSVETLQTEDEKEKLLDLISGTESGLLDLSVSEQDRDLRETSSGAFQSSNGGFFTELLDQQPNYETQEAIERRQSEEELIDSRFQSSEAGYHSQERMGQEGDLQSSVQTEEMKGKLVELITGESGLMSVTGMSSYTAESGLLDQSVSEQSAMTGEEALVEMMFHMDPGLQTSEDGYLHHEADQSLENTGQEGGISMQAENVREKLEELISGQSGLVSVTGMSSSTAESGLLDQSVSERERDLGEASIGSFLNPYEKLFTELPTPQPNYESQEATETGQSAMTGEEAIAEVMVHMDPGLQTSEDGYLLQESDQSLENTAQEGGIQSSMQAEKVREKLEELISWESGLMSVTGMSSSTAESGLLDHVVRDDMLAAGISPQELNVVSQEATETGQSAMTGEDPGLQTSEDGYMHQESLEKNGQEGGIQSSMQAEKVREKLEELISGESGLMSATGMSSSTAESGLLDHVVRDDMLSAEKSPQELNFGQSAMTDNESTTEMGFHPDCRIREQEAALQESDQSQQKQDEEGDDTAECETSSQTGIGAEDTDLPIITHEETTKGEHSGSESSFQEETMLTESHNDSEEEFMFSSLNKVKTWSDDTYDSLPKLIRPETAEEPATYSDLPIEMNMTNVLDFTAQKSRIALKNPNVRPPQNPRSLLHMPSEDPTPTTHPPARAPMGVAFGGVGMGIQLPGLGAGFPVLKRVVAEDRSSEESETKPEEKSDSPKPDEAQHRPKWMPQTHQGFGNPFMSELKTKLRKTTEE